MARLLTFQLLLVMLLLSTLVMESLARHCVLKKFYCCTSKKGYCCLRPKYRTIPCSLLSSRRPLRARDAQDTEKETTERDADIVPEENDLEHLSSQP
ncbi:hypothetical protein ACOMHN_053899 [Nucella lapillus]